MLIGANMHTAGRSSGPIHAGMLMQMILGGVNGRITFTPTGGSIGRHTRGMLMFPLLRIGVQLRQLR